MSNLKNVPIQYKIKETIELYLGKNNIEVRTYNKK